MTIEQRIAELQDAVKANDEIISALKTKIKANAEISKLSK